MQYGGLVYLDGGGLLLLASFNVRFSWGKRGPWSIVPLGFCMWRCVSHHYTEVSCYISLGNWVSAVEFDLVFLYVYAWHVYYSGTTVDLWCYPPIWELLHHDTLPSTFYTERYGENELFRILCERT